MPEFIADTLDSRNRFTATDCRETPVNSCKGYLNIIHVSVTWFQNDFYAWKAKITAYVAKTFGKSVFAVIEELGTILNHVTTSDTTSLEDTAFSPILAQTSRQKYWHDPLLLYKASVTLNTLLFINRMRSFGKSPWLQRHNMLWGMVLLAKQMMALFHCNSLKCWTGV